MLARNSAVEYTAIEIHVLKRTKEAEEFTEPHDVDTHARGPRFSIPN
jgi:hypothetical protein